MASIPESPSRRSHAASPQGKTGTPRIVTHYEPKPIPTRQFDWTAIDDNTYDGEGCPIGFGSTEQEAIDDLKAQLEDDDQ